MIYVGILAAVLVVAVIVALINCWVGDQDRLEMQMKIEETMRRLTPPWTASEYLSRIEKASVEILSHKKPVDKNIVLWWGVDGLRMNEDGSTEWVSRKKPEKQPEPERKPANQNVFHQPPQYMAMVQTVRPFDMRNMCQNTRAQIDALQAQIDCCRMQAIQTQQNALLISQLAGRYYPLLNQNYCQWR